MGTKSKYIIQLTESERENLLEIVTKGVHKSRTLKRAQAFLWLDEGMQHKDVVQLSRVSGATLILWKKRFLEERLDALFDKPRSGRPSKISPEDEAKLTALACSQAPDGRARWTLVLLRDHFLQLTELESVCPETIRQALKKTYSNHGSINIGS